jgi:hypothetical protein
MEEHIRAEIDVEIAQATGVEVASGELAKSPRD